MILVSKMTMTFALLFLTVAIVALFFTPIGRMQESAAIQKINTNAMEVASVISEMKMAEEGTEYTFDLPRIPQCVMAVFKGFVYIYSGSTKAAAGIISGDGTKASDVEPWDRTQNCFEKNRLVFKKQNGKVVVELRAKTA